LRLTLTVLDLVCRLIEEAARGDPGGPTIVTAVVEDLDRHHKLIEQAVRHAEGAYVDAADAADGVLAGPDMPELERVVRASFTRPGPVSVARVGDQMVASIGGAPASAASASVRETLGIAASLFDAQLQGRSLVAISYRETNLDPFAADEAWGFFSRQLRGIPIGTITSILILVNTPRARYRRFCTPEVSLRYRLEGQRLSERKPWSVDEGNIRRLRSEARGNGVVLFLGAGFSQSSSLPFGNDLRDEAARSLLGSAEARPEELAALLFDRLNSEGRLSPAERALTRPDFARQLTLERVLQEELARTPPSDSPTLRYLADRDAQAVASPARGPLAVHELIRGGAKIVVVTVNFDHLVEAGLPSFRVFAADDEFTEATEHVRQYMSGADGRVPILKIHGTIERPETVVATVNAIAAGLSAAKRSALTELAALDLPWIYVGYSLRDPDVRTVLQSREFQDRPEWWVSPFPVLAVEQFNRDFRPNHDPRRGTFITQGSDAFFESLAAPDH
jgi:hypothetical protein